MNLLNRKILTVTAAVLIAAAGCSGNRNPKDAAPADAGSATVKKNIVNVGTETQLLLDDLAANGDYVNSTSYPSLIKASIVHDNLGNKQLVIDLRSPEKFRLGHIKGAVNKKFEDLPEYFVSGIKPFEYEKIVLVCDDGQVSSYTTCLLRLKGYGNVYAMRWGMSSWNMAYANNGWLAGLSGNFENRLDTAVHEKQPGVSLPELKTGLASGEAIGEARFDSLFAEGTSSVLITSEEVFADPSKFYVINLDRKDKYEDGHIPGAVRYKPESTLGFKEEMASIPNDKTVVVYCGTGHNSAFATAYLRLFGYDARTLKYGNNSFMYDRMLAKKEALSWLPFSKTDVNDYPVIK